MSEATVWLAPVDDVSGKPSFPWQGSASSVSLWTREHRLVVQRSTRLDRAQGEATFRLFRNNVVADTAGPQSYESNIQLGAWVAVCHSAGRAQDADPEQTEMDPATIDWFGYLDDRQVQLIAGAIDGPGIIVARRVGHLFDGVQVKGWAREETPGDEYGTAFNRPPTANLEGQDGLVIGNAVSISDANLPTGLQAQKVFTRKPSACGTAPAKYFTRLDLLRHVAGYCMPDLDANFPEIDLDMDANVASLLGDTSTPEVYQLRPLNLDGLLDLCVPDALGLAWDIAVVESDGFLSWELRVYATSDTAASTDHPNAKASATNITADDLEGVIPTFSDYLAGLYDEVVVEGAPYLFAITVSPYDYNLAQGWSDDDETTYAAVGEGLGDAGTARLRSQPHLQHVGRRFLAQGLVLEYDLRTQVEPVTGAEDLSTGTSYAGDIIAAIPQVRVDLGSSTALGAEVNTYDPGNTVHPGLFLSDDTSRAPYLPSAEIYPDLPWLVGRLPDSIADNRPDEMKARPEYLPPRVFLYDGTSTWTDLLADDRAETPQLKAAGGGLAFDLKFGKQEYLLAALSDWEGRLFPEADWNELVLTIAIESDQTLIARRTRADGIAIRRSLTIPRPDFACWFVRRGAILGLNADGTPLRAENDMVTRDDSKAINRLADLVSAWAFRDRQRVSLRHQSPFWNPSWLRLGTVIGTMDDGGVTREIHTPIRSITRDYQQGIAGTLIATDTPALPGGLLSAVTSFSGGPSSPTQSGPISPVDLQATVAQHTARVAEEQRRQGRDRRKRVLIEARGGTAVADQVQLAILGGNELNPGVVAGIKKVSTLLAETATTRDPGSRATAGSVTITSGAITAATVAEAGSVYDNTLSPVACTVTGDGTGAVVTATISGGEVTGFNVVAGGSGYTTASITVPNPTGTPAGLPWEDGLGYGVLTDADGNESRVLILLDSRSVLQEAAPKDTVLNLATVTTIEVTDDPGATLPVRIPWMV